MHHQLQIASDVVLLLDTWSGEPAKFRVTSYLLVVILIYYYSRDITIVIYTRWTNCSLQQYPTIESYHPVRKGNRIFTFGQNILSDDAVSKLYHGVALNHLIIVLTVNTEIGDIWHVLFEEISFYHI